MPLFLYDRWNGKKLKDYTLTEENIKKIKNQLEFNKSKKKNGIDYLNHCAYMCVPNNYYNSTYAMGRNNK